MSQRFKKQRCPCVSNREITALPDECIELMEEYLDLLEIVTWARTCKRLQSLSSLPILLQRPVLRAEMFKLDQLRDVDRALLKHCTNLVHIDFICRPELLFLFPSIA